MRKWIKTLFFVLCLLIFDVLTKFWVQKNIPSMSLLHPFYPYGGIGILDFFGVKLSINYVANYGAAWGLFSNYPNILFYLRIVVVSSLIIYVIFSKERFRKKIPFFLIIAGAFGNIIDYIFYGFVVDMIHFQFGSYSYPVFNLADSYITIGIIWLFVDYFISLFCGSKKK